MKERTAEIRTDDGTMETFVTHPEEDGPHAAVILYMDVWGMREELLDVARRVATVGYYCLVPDLLYRHGRVRFDHRDADGRRISLSRLDDDARAAVLAPARSTSDEMVMADTESLLRFLDAGEPVRPGALSAFGYCWGGRVVLRAASRFPDRFRASGVLHGTSLVTEEPDSPHLGADRVGGEIYCGFGERDPYSPPPLIRTLAEVLGAAPADFRFQVHPGAEHGYALPDRDIHDKTAANRDWERIFAMFRRQIPPPA